MPVLSKFIKNSILPNTVYLFTLDFEESSLPDDTCTLLNTRFLQLDRYPCIFLSLFVADNLHLFPHEETSSVDDMPRICCF